MLLSPKEIKTAFQINKKLQKATKMSVPELIGWELLYKLIENNLRSESDIIIAIAHWFLIKEGIFRCIGVGDKVCFFLFFYHNMNLNNFQHI